MDGIHIFMLAILGAVLGLDVVSFPQAMLSRPIVAATLSGALMGDSMGGLLAGAALELVALETLPVGASRYPEWGSASVVGGAIVATNPDRAGALSVTLLAAITVGWVGGWTMVQLRTMNARWAKRLRPYIERGERRAVVGLQLAGLGADFLRGFLLTWVSLLAFRPVGRAVLGVWGADARLSRAVAVTVAASVAAAAVWKLFRVTEHARWYLLGGLALGLAAMALK
jgi:mannose/fructose/N-acetylgalactosamine-specific phosphotransferase system component IIC